MAHYTVRRVSLQTNFSLARRQTDTVVGLVVVGLVVVPVVVAVSAYREIC